MTIGTTIVPVHVIGDDQDDVGPGSAFLFLLLRENWHSGCPNSAINNKTAELFFMMKGG